MAVSPRMARLRSLNPDLLALALLLLITLVLFGDLLFSSEEVVLSHPSTDLALQFVYWREFGFNQLREGNLALWNPHIFSGTPYLGGFQSALLYPPNWFYLILPLARAINFGIALHLFLSGIFTYLWVAGRGLHRVAALMSAILFMGCGAHFLHVHAGHLTNLCTIAWVPLLFLCLDRYFETRSTGWILLGMATVALQILAGHPQYVFFTGVAAGLYTLLRSWRSGSAGRMLLGVAAVYLGAAALSAVQLLTGLEANQESVRSGGISYQMASMFSFPLENFVTLLAPGFLGNMVDFPYWGRWYLWEMSLFFGVTGLVLAIYGAFRGPTKARRFSVWMALLLLLLALGDYSPLFSFLYHWVPGFSLFRSSAKFILPASAFAVMLAAIGLDQLFRKPVPGKRLALPLLATAVLAATAGLVIHQLGRSGAGGLWFQWLQWMGSTQEVYLTPAAYQDPEFARQAATGAARSLLGSALTLLLLSGLFWLAQRTPKAVYLIAALASVEVLLFAAGSRPSFDLKATRLPEIREFLDAHPGDYRILYPEVPNMAMSLPADNLWGYDPGVLTRYAEFMAFTQGLHPDQASQYLQFTRYHPLYEMLRCRYLFLPGEQQIEVKTAPRTMPRLHLIQRWTVLRERDAIFKAMESAAFDPWQQVILEETPVPSPVRTDEPGRVSLLESSTDHLIIEAALPAPAILLVTDNYSSGWRASPLPGSGQQNYRVLPANYTLMAIPLEKGSHRLRLEYLPAAFQWGRWISMLALFGWTAAAVLCIRPLALWRGGKG